MVAAEACFDVNRASAPKSVLRLRKFLSSEGA